MKTLIIATLLILSTSVKVNATSIEEGVAGIAKIMSETDTADIKKILWQSKSYSDDEIEMLAKMVEAEIEGGNIESKKNVVSVILNRVYNDNFPSTIKDVILQKGQFESVGNGRYKKAEPTEETYQAIEEVLKDGATTEATYFCNLDNIKSSKVKKWFKEKLKFLFKDDSNHSFFVEKE